MKQTASLVVVLSGGQDSVTCLALAKARAKTVHAISFDYGQRHALEELTAAHYAFRALGCNGVHHTACIPALGRVARSALTGEGSVNEVHPLNASLPASFVPSRNAVFLALAHAFALDNKADGLVTGVCQTDFSGYPDCRRDFIDALEAALALGYGKVTIGTPLMSLDKAQTFYLADRLGALELVVHHSHTCYNGDPTPNSWGKGCGQCPACELRRKGYERFRRDDFNRFEVDAAFAF